MSKPNLLLDAVCFGDPINRNRNLLSTPNFRQPVNQQYSSKIPHYTVDKWCKPAPPIFDAKDEIEMESVYELAKRYYPRLWNKSRLEALVEAGRLTEEEFREIVGEEPEESGG